MVKKRSLKEKLASRRKDLKNRAAGGKFFIIPEGTTRVRPVPVGEEKDFAAEVVYFYLGEKIRGVISPHTWGEKCAIMNAYNLLTASKKASERELAKKFKPSKRYFVPVIKYKDERGKEVDHQSKVKLLLLSTGTYQEILDLWLDDEFGDFTDPKNGYDIKIKRTGKGLKDTEYSVIRCNPTPLSKKYAGDIYNPEEMAKAITPKYKETKAFIEEFLSLPQDDDEEERPRKKKKKVKRDL